MPVPELSKQMIGRMRNDWARHAKDVKGRPPNAGDEILGCAFSVLNKQRIRSLTKRGEQLAEIGLRMRKIGKRMQEEDPKLAIQGMHFRE